jgi:hypothetical protein
MLVRFILLPLFLNSLGWGFFFNSSCGQIECELLDRPDPTGSLIHFQESQKVNDIFRDLLNSSYPVEGGFLAPEEFYALKAIARNFQSIMDESTQGFVGDALEEARNKAWQMQNQAAPAMLKEMETVLGEKWPVIVFKVNRKLTQGHRDPSRLTYPTVMDGLQLSPEQSSQFKQLQNQFEFYAKEQRAELAKQLKSLLEEHFAALKTELDSVQRTRFLHWFGELNLFEALSMSDEYKEVISEAARNRSVGQTAGTIEVIRHVDDDGQRVEPPTDRQELTIDYLLYKALTMNNLEKQLVLSPDQKRQIDDQLHGKETRLILEHRRTERMLAILEDKWELPEWLHNILLPHQKNWLRQFEFQVYNMPYADSFGVLNPDVSESLDLTKEQRERVVELAVNYRTKVADLVRRVDRTLLQQEKEIRIKMFKLLKPEQILQYRRWFGVDPIDL